MTRTTHDPHGIEEKNRLMDWDPQKPLPKGVEVVSTVSTPKPDFTSSQWNSQIDAMIAEIEEKMFKTNGITAEVPVWEIVVNGALKVAKQILLTYKK